MDKPELQSKIRSILTTKYGKSVTTQVPPPEPDEFNNHPELKLVIHDLLTVDYNSFMASIDWVAPKPTMFRINLKNDHSFYLTWNERSWIAQIEGKKYYLLNLPEEQRALEALSRLLKYGTKEKKKGTESTPDEESPLDNMEQEAEPETEE